jgi:hypothetical protein
MIYHRGYEELDVKKQNYLKGFIDYQSEGSHYWATWASNHMGWAKMKKLNKKVAKRREKRELDKQIRGELDGR